MLLTAPNILVILAYGGLWGACLYCGLVASLYTLVMPIREKNAAALIRSTIREGLLFGFGVAALNVIIIAVVELFKMLLA